MKFKGTKLSKRTIALLAAALVLLGSGGTMGTRAVLNIISPNYDATIQLDQLGVQLLENGTKVADSSESDKVGTLYSSLTEGFKVSQKVEDKVSVKNSGNAPEYVRVIVRKYWTNTENNTKTDLTKTLAPKWIELTTAIGWKEVKGSNNEYSVYYLSEPLAVNATKDLFTHIRINEKVLTEGKKIKIGDTEYPTDAAARDAAKDGDVITYSYTYDGCSFNVEAEVQSVQTHNYVDAMKSVWGVNASDVL